MSDRRSDADSLLSAIFQENNPDEIEDAPDENQLYEDSLQIAWDNQSILWNTFVNNRNMDLVFEAFRDDPEFIRLERQQDVVSIKDSVDLLVGQERCLWTQTSMLNFIQTCFRQSVDPLYGLESADRRREFVMNILNLHVKEKAGREEAARKRAQKEEAKAQREEAKKERKKNGKKEKKKRKKEKVVDPLKERIELEYDPETGEAIRVKGYNKDGTKRAKTVHLTDALEDSENKKDWSSCRIKAWSSLGVGADGSEGYHYRFNHYGQGAKTGKWDATEHTIFMENAKRLGVNRCWGNFSKIIPGRVGYTVSSYYRKLCEKGWIWDNFYVLKNDGSGKTSMVPMKDCPLNEKDYNRRQRYSFVVLRDPSNTFTDLPAFSPKADPEFVEAMKNNAVIKERVEYFKNVTHKQLVGVKNKKVKWGYAEVLWKDRLWHHQDGAKGLFPPGSIPVKKKKKKKAGKKRKSEDDFEKPMKKKRKKKAKKPAKKRSSKRRRRDDSDDEVEFHIATVEFVNPMPDFDDAVTKVTIERPAFHLVDLDKPNGDGYCLGLESWRYGKKYMANVYNRRELIKLTCANIDEYRHRIVPFPLIEKMIY